MRREGRSTGRQAGDLSDTLNVETVLKLHVKRKVEKKEKTLMLCCLLGVVVLSPQYFKALFFTEILTVPSGRLAWNLLGLQCDGPLRPRSAPSLV